MGDRSLIVITSESEQSPIAFYGHWAGDYNLTAVRNVLARTDRVGDVGYLAAQIFYEFAVEGSGFKGTTGFGIHACGEDGFDWLDNETVTVNADTGEYTYDGVVYPYKGGGVK